MIQHFSHLDQLTILSSIASTSNPIPEEAYQRVSSLMLMLIILSLITLIVLSLIIVLRRNQRRKADLPKQSPTVHTDAWSESGKRFDSSIVEIDPELDEPDD